MSRRASTSAAKFVPARRTLENLRSAARSCEGCDLYRNATQTVFGEGAEKASLLLVGEQPGDMEDREGHPFVGPAGRILDRALGEAEIPRQQVYITNAVKHFKFIQRGKRRLHQKPLIRQVTACRPWLEAEFQAIQPKVVVCMGATAAQSVLGRSVRVTEERGRFLSNGERTVFLTTHPSAILRLREKSERDEAFRRLVDEMKLVGSKLRQMKAL
jgi:uracil-DNA glycosylase family protein